MGAEQEDVAGGGLDGEVLVHRADRDAVGVEDHPVVPGLGDGPATGQGGQPRSPPGPEPAVDRVVVEVGPTATPASLDAPGDQVDHLVEGLPGEPGVGAGPSDQVEERADLPLLGRRHLGHQLLGQDVDRGHRGLEQVEMARLHPGQEGGALHQLVPGHGVEPAGGGAVELVVGPADPLEEGPDGPRRPDLADQLHRAHIDAQLQ